MKHQRLFIVANRLPICVTGEKEGASIQPVSGGLVSAVNSYLQHSQNNFSEVFWAGVPGCSPATWNEASNHLPQSPFTYLPVLVYKEQYEKYYNGFSNSVLWPLFHYFPSYAEYQAEDFEYYTKVNDQFAEVLSKQCREGDTVWIHDYHLLPLSGMLRKRFPSIKIGFFLHIPFPSFEILRLMPKKWQEDILNGMLGADLVGFHTIDYASHFLESVQKVLALDHERNIIRCQDRLVKVDVFPISIDYEFFNNAYDRKEVEAIRQDLQLKMKHCKIIFSVDRLDYTKGVHNRLRAYELFLHQHPDYHNKVVFVINVVPSRDQISKYMERKQMIDVLISDINSRIGNLHWQPVIYRYNSMDFDEMVALYTACDLALITPLRDGMNLVAKEFVASRKDQQGVLVLSEMAGAARELTSGLIINPNDVQEMADKIKEGLEMHSDEQAGRMKIMQERLANYDVKAWAEDFMMGLSNIKEKQQTFQEIFLDNDAKRNIFDRFRSAEKRLLLLDYDGTLVPYAPKPEEARPGEELLELLSGLSRKENTDIYLISGRNSAWLEKHFSSLPVHLIAEHGAKYKRKKGEWSTEVQTHSEWRGAVYNIMEMYVRRCPNSFVEEKEFSMVWHYRNADVQQGTLRSQELVSELSDYLNLRHLQVIAGNKIVEVRNRGIDKGTAIKKILDNADYDFIFAVGDDKTDEDMFKALVGKKNCFTIKVGPNASYAQYNLLKPQMVVSLLEGLNFLPITPLVH
jgi:trehalose 6-phosphate synthase/phosphatase